MPVNERTTLVLEARAAGMPLAGSGFGEERSPVVCAETSASDDKRRRATFSGGHSSEVLFCGKSVSGDSSWSLSSLCLRTSV